MRTEPSGVRCLNNASRAKFCEVQIFPREDESEEMASRSVELNQAQVLR